MAEKITLEQVRDWHYETAREKDQTGELRFPGPNESPFYRFPSEQSKLHDAMADAIDAHLTQPAQAVDVGAIREVIEDMRCYLGSVDAWNEKIDKLTRAIGNAQPKE